MSRILLILCLLAVVMIGCNQSFLPGNAGNGGSGEGSGDGNNGVNNEGNDGGNGGATAKVIPESVKLDLDELVAAEQAAGFAWAQELPPAMQQVNSEAQRTLNQLDEMTRRFAQINALITDETATQISGEIIWDTRVNGAIPGPGGSQQPNPGAGTGETRLIKVDFGAFDYDQDGVDDGSGSPLTAPVALRVWVTDADGVYQPAACGLITTLPTEEHPGAGELHTLSYARNGDGDIAIIRWSQANPADKLLETWDEHPQGPPGAWGYSSFLVRHLAVGELVEKTVKSTIDGNALVARYYGGAPAAYIRDNALDPAYYFIETLESAAAEDAWNVSTEDFDILPLRSPSVFPWPATFAAEPTF